VTVGQVRAELDPAAREISQRDIQLRNDSGDLKCRMCMSESNLYHLASVEAQLKAIANTLNQRFHAVEQSQNRAEQTIECI